MAIRSTLRIGNRLQTPEKKRRLNEAMFTEIAPHYDFITRALSFWQDAVWKRDMIAELPPMSEPICVDIACGTGDIAFLLAEKYPTGKILGLDITDKMLDIAHARNNYSNVSFIPGDMSRLDFAAHTVDIITGGYALRNAPSLQTVLVEIRRVLKPGGIATFLDFSKPEKKWLQRFKLQLLKLWTGFWGFLLHRNPEVYGYIAHSLEKFPDREGLRYFLRMHGFEIIAARPHLFGFTETILVRRVR